MIKTGIFVVGVACGFAAASWMTEQQRRQVTKPVRVVAGSDAAQRLSETVHDVATAAAETATNKIGHITGTSGNGNESSTFTTTG